MSNSDTKFTKVLFLIITVILVLFFVTGIYFMQSNAMGAGFLGVGIAVLGLGLMGLFANGVLYQSVSGPAVTQSRLQRRKANVSDIENPEFQMDAIIGYDDGHGGLKNGIVYLCADRMYLKNLEPETVKIIYSDIENMSHEKNRMVIYGMFSFGGQLKRSAVCVTCESSIKLMAFIQILDAKYRSYHAAVSKNGKAGDVS